MSLEIKDLYVQIEGKEVISGLNLKINQGEVHVIMGPNGSGKTTLAKAIFGHPAVTITKGDIIVDGNSILELTTDKRAALGLFLGFQHPVEIEGVGFVNFLRASRESLSNGTIDMKQMMSEIRLNAQSLKMNEGIIGRPLNKGFSGGEKKKAEVLQMAMQKPKIALLDEPDSGLDIDAIRIVAENINEVAKQSNTGLIVITHYSRILEYMKPDFVHVMIKGKIVQEGRGEMIEKLEREGYGAFQDVNGE